MPPVPRTGSCADHLKMASAQPVRLSRDSMLMKLFLALAAERRDVRRTDSVIAATLAQQFANPRTPDEAVKACNDCGVAFVVVALFQALGVIGLRQWLGLVDAVALTICGVIVDSRPIVAAMPFIDDFLPVHSLQSLADLGVLLSDLGVTPRPSRRQNVVNKEATHA